MSAIKIVRELETYDISQVLDIYTNLSDDSVNDIDAYLVDRKIGNRSVVKHQSGKDPAGHAGKAAATITAAVGGGGTVVASGFGGTILGSSGLGSLLGGILTVSTPIGWVIGGAAAAAALAYGASKLVESGSKHDYIRSTNIRNAQSAERYNSRRTIDPLLFTKRAEVLEAIILFNKLKKLSPEGFAIAELEIEEMFNSTSSKKISCAHDVVN